MTTAITLKNVSLTYSERIIFSNLHFEVQQNQWVAILGKSGVGKTSLLRMMAGLIPSATQHSLNNFSYMGQTDLLLPWLTVTDNVTLGPTLRSENKKSQHQLHATAKNLLEKVGLKNAMQKYPHELSGGMRQRVALVRTLIEAKPIVLMDEPFSVLDTITRHHMQTLTAELLCDKTVVFVTHDPTEALRLAHDIYLMYENPAQLKKILTLSSSTPRNLNDKDFMHWQARLFELLAETNMRENT